MKKLMLAAGLVSTVAIGSTAFIGGDIIDKVNAKVSGMFDMISTYESNETILVNKINDLKSQKLSLKEQLKNMQNTLDDKDTNISEANNKISKLERQIEILESQLGDKTGLVSEITRLEDEVNKANSKVSELQAILDTEITDAPLTANELEENLMEFNGVITLNSTMESKKVVTLCDYAQLTIIKLEGSVGTFYEVTVESTTMDGFNVELGHFGGSSRSVLCYPGQPYTFNIYPNENPYQYLKINDGEFIYKLDIK